MRVKRSWVIRADVVEARAERSTTRPERKVDDQPIFAATAAPSASFFSA